MLGRRHLVFLVCLPLLIASCSSGGGGDSTSGGTRSSSSNPDSVTYSFEDLYANPWDYSESEIKNTYLELLKEQYPGSFELTEIPVEDLWEFYTVLRGSTGYLRVEVPDIRNPRGQSQIINDWDVSGYEGISVPAQPLDPSDQGVAPSSESSNEAASLCRFMASPVDFQIDGYLEDGTPIKGDDARVIGEYVLKMEPFEKSGSHSESCLVEGSLKISGRAADLPRYAAMEFDSCDHDTMLLDGTLMVGLFGFAGETNPPGHLFGILDREFDISKQIESLAYTRGYFYNQFESSSKPFAGCESKFSSDFSPSPQEWSNKQVATGYLLEDKVLEGSDVVSYSNQFGIYFSNEEYDWFLLQESSRQEALSNYADVQKGRIGLAEFGTLDFSWQIAEEGLPYPMINEIGRYTFIGRSGERAIFSWNEYDVIRILIDDGQSVRGLYASPLYEQFGNGRPTISSDMLAPLSQLSHPPVLPFFVSLAHDVEQGIVAAEHMEAITDPDGDDKLLVVEYRWYVNDELFIVTSTNSVAVNALPVDTETVSVEIYASDGFNEVKHRVVQFLTEYGESSFRLP